MIPRPTLTAWRRQVPWREDYQVEWDLLLSTFAVAIAIHPHLSNELAWRGGTCLHKLHLQRPRRFSEDLDYVLVARGRTYREVADDIQAVAQAVGLTLRGNHTKLSSSRIKVNAGFTPTAPGPGQDGLINIKVEVNTADPPGDGIELVRLPHEVDATRWPHNGMADVLTFAAPSLIGSKFRALGQRRKGRDLSDVWLARNELDIEDHELARAAWWYTFECESLTPAELIDRVDEALQDPSFVADLDALVVAPYEGYDPTAYGRELMRWIDVHLEPMHRSTRSESARLRIARHEEKAGRAPGRLRCLGFDDTPGGRRRCRHWLLPGDPCPDHGRQP